MMPGTEMSGDLLDWGVILLYLVCILLVSALVLYLIFYLYDRCYPTKDGSEINKSNEEANEGKEVEISKNVQGKKIVLERQTMLSSLLKSDDDVILATALSSIPLKELGGKHNDIIIDIGQQMYMDNGEKKLAECIVCKRKDITWAQLPIRIMDQQHPEQQEQNLHQQPQPQSQEPQQQQQQQPQQPLTMPAISVDQVLKMFDISDDSLKSIKYDITKELELGLSDEDSATIKMLITYVRELSRGDEVGNYLALDLGGTHFRVLLVKLQPGLPPKVTTALHNIPQELLVTQNGQELFDYIALKLLEFVQQYKLKRQRISLGFTFSFPCKQYGLTQSVLVKWCKGFKVGGVVGTDVVKQLKDALKRQLSGLVEAYIDVVAVINDTTGTLVACANTNKDCRIGLIVGTGFNACYMEQLHRCEKWPANYTYPKQVIINCEWGAMGDNKDRRELDKYRNEFDFEIDAQSVNPKNQTFEKMVAGMYVGELLRLAMLKLYKNKLLFAHSNEPSTSPRHQRPISPDSSSSMQNVKISSNSGCTKAVNEQHKLNVKDILNGRHLSMLGKDELNGNFEETAKIMSELNVSHYSEKDLAIVVQLGSKIMHRGAALVAVGISALLEKIKRPFSVIGYDGSVVKYHPYFLKKVIEKCAILTPKELKFEFMVSSDGSGIGAAVVAAALHKERRPLYVVKPGKLYEMHFVRAGHQSSISLN